jgi:hypothetical protein
MNRSLGLCDLLPNFHPRVADRQWLSDELLNDHFMMTFDIGKAARLIRARDANMVIMVIMIINGAADA